MRRGSSNIIVACHLRSIVWQMELMNTVGFPVNPCLMMCNLLFCIIVLYGQVTFSASLLFIKEFFSDTKIIETSEGRVSFPTENSLSVRFTSADDMGSYRCVARNPVGSDSKEVFIFVQGLVFMSKNYF